MFFCFTSYCLYLHHSLQLEHHINVIYYKLLSFQISLIQRKNLFLHLIFLTKHDKN
jgi:hypothetical protein